MTTRIEASTKKLEDQAILSTFRYLKETRQKLDELFGKDFAKSNPDMVSSIVQTISYEYRSNVQLAGTQGVDEEVGNIAQAIDNIAIKLNPTVKRRKSMAMLDNTL